MNPLSRKEKKLLIYRYIQDLFVLGKRFLPLNGLAYENCYVETYTINFNIDEIGIYTEPNEHDQISTTFLVKRPKRVVCSLRTINEVSLEEED